MNIYFLSHDIYFLSHDIRRILYLVLLYDNIPFSEVDIIACKKTFAVVQFPFSVAPKDCNLFLLTLLLCVVVHSMDGEREKEAVPTSFSLLKHFPHQYQCCIQNMWLGGAN